MCHINAPKVTQFCGIIAPSLPFPYQHPHPLPRGLTTPRASIPTRLLEMTLIRRQNTSSQMFDDQSPTLWDSYVGNWTRYSISGFNNQTATATPTPGASLTFNFTGAQIVDPWVCCVVLTL